MRFVSPLLHQLFQIIAVKGLKVLYKKIEILAEKTSLASHFKNADFSSTFWKKNPHCVKHLRDFFEVRI